MITTFLRLISSLNNLLFNSRIYLQIKACAMGTICALHTQTYSYRSSKRDTSILLLKKNPETICALSTIFLWYEPNQRAIWKKCPKDVFVSKKVLEIAVASATTEFNDGSNWLKPVFNDLGVNFGYLIKKGLNKKDNLRIRQSVRRSCDHGKMSRAKVWGQLQRTGLTKKIRQKETNHLIQQDGFK